MTDTFEIYYNSLTYNYIDDDSFDDLFIDACVKNKEASIFELFFLSGRLNINRINIKGSTDLLFQIILHKRYDIFSLMLSHVTEIDINCLIELIKQKNVHYVKLLLFTKKVNILDKNEDGKTVFDVIRDNRSIFFGNSELDEINSELIKYKEEIGFCTIENLGNYKDVISELTYVTPLSNLRSIIESGYLYNREDRIKFGIEADSGFGNSSEELYNLCEPCSNFSRNPEMSKYCKDAKGITLDFWAFGHKFVDRFTDTGDESVDSKDDCILIFSNEVLENNYYHVTNEDNLGFYVYNHHIAGSMGDQKTIERFNYVRSYNDSEIKELTEEEYLTRGTELLVRKSIPLKFLKYIIFYNQSSYDSCKYFLGSIEYVILHPN